MGKNSDDKWGLKMDLSPGPEYEFNFVLWGNWMAHNELLPPKPMVKLTNKTVKLLYS